MKDNIKELIGSIAFGALVWLMLWAYCAATPNQLSGETDWNEEALREDAEEENEQNQETCSKMSLAEEYAEGDLVFNGANVEDSGHRVTLTLSFLRARANRTH